MPGEVGVWTAAAPQASRLACGLSPHPGRWLEAG